MGQITSDKLLDPSNFVDRVPLLDKVATAFLGPFTVLFAVGSCFLRRLAMSNGLSLNQDLLRSVLRSLATSLPISVRRKLSNPTDTDDVLNSTRFRNHRHNLCERVSGSNFSGYWICKGPPGKAQTPSKSDLTILWIHGGGYVAGHPLRTMTQMLRVSEFAAELGMSASIFALQYSLAPEAAFPTQIEQGIASYQYLIEEMDIDPARVVFLGESAGGHLTVSLLYELNLRNLTKPGKALLVSPWVNLTNSSATFVTNKYKDALDKADLDRCRDAVLGADGKERFPHLINFTLPLPNGRTWNDILPETWIVIGSQEILLADALRFVEVARANSVNIVLHVEDERPHGWTGVRDFLDSKAYCKLDPSDPVGGLMAMAQLISEDLLLSVRKSLSSSNRQLIL